LNYESRFRKIGILLLALGLLGASLSVPRTARANSGNSFLETMGISIAVGTVLGASTLPFYDQPGKHLMNLAYGASAGAVVGVGVLTYGWLAGTTQDEYGQANDLDKGLSPDREAYAQPRSRSTHSSRSLATHVANVHYLNLETGPEIVRVSASAAAGNRGAVPVRSAQFWMPVVSLNW
jgi:hypothetical protein